MPITIVLSVPNTATVCSLKVHTTQPLLSQIRAAFPESITKGRKISVTWKCAYITKTNTTKTLGLKSGDQLKVSYKIPKSEALHGLRRNILAEGYDPNKFTFLDDDTAVYIYR